MSSTAVTPLPNIRDRIPKPEPPPSIEPFISAMRWLIETLVLERLQGITDQIKRLDFGEVTNPRNQQAIRLREVLRLLTISKSTLYDRLNPKSALHDPALPRPFKLGDSQRSPTVWWQHEVLAYLQSRADQTRSI